MNTRINTNHNTLGKNQTRMLRLYAHGQLHGFASDPTTVKTAKSLQRRGLITINEFKQAKITRSGMFCAWHLHFVTADDLKAYGIWADVPLHLQEVNA